MSGDAEPVATRRGSVHTPPLPTDLCLVAEAGPDRGARLALGPGTFIVGSAPACNLVLRDPGVSRRHLEVALVDGAVRLRDLGSTNGTFFRGGRFEGLRVGPGAVITLGETALALRSAAELLPPPPGARRFGAAIGGAGMAPVFDLLARVAASDATVLLRGETGTGKEVIAQALHAASSRAGGPFVVADLGSIPRGVFESELFGHERGAFTGADEARDGAFVAADGGTLFLDEIGELEESAQPLLLRALERREVRPVGAKRYRKLDLRVVAATHRDLEADVQRGAFRADLYHRLSVVRVVLPPLRERPADVPLLVEHLLAAAAGPGRPPPRVAAATLVALAAHDWPGNVRELRNVLERAVALGAGADEIGPELLGLTVDPIAPSDAAAGGQSFREAKGRLIAAWERDFLAGLLARSGGNVSEAARLGGLDRPYLYRLLKKHGLGG